MRIVAGQWAGRELVSPGRRVRPTSESVRATALDWVARELPGARVVDLFAGTGALGLEALSRGAATADFVERNPAALHALKANVARFRLKGSARIFKKDVLDFLSGAHEAAYDLAFADPPYTSTLSERVVEHWLAHPFSRILLVECGKDRALPAPHKRRVVADTALVLYRMRRARAPSGK